MCRESRNLVSSSVIPAKAGIQGYLIRIFFYWIPAYAGMTEEGAWNDEKERE